MLNQQWLRFVFVLCLLSAHAEVRAGYPVVGRAPGTLAVQVAPDGEWRVVSAGGILPDVGTARTTATGPSHVRSEHGTLSLGSLSQVQYDLTARQATLLTGRVFCAPADGKPWTINAAKFRIVVPAGGAEIFVEAKGNLTVTVLQGKAEITTPESKLISVAERTVCSISGTPPKSDIKPLGPATEQYLTRWTKQLPPGQGLGQLVIKDSQTTHDTRLNIARYHAEVVLQPPVALIKLDQSFYNPTSTQQEGEFIFNLPPGASVSRFAMFVTKDQLIEGEVIERRRADEVYTTIVRSKRDPAILEQIGDSLFKMRVFPIFAKDVKRILLDFTLPLDGRGGQYQMQLPLLSDLRPIWDFRLFGSIRGPTPLASAQCPTIPELTFAARGANEIAFDFVRRNDQPVSDLVIAFQQPAPQQASTFRRLQAEPLNLPVPAENLQQEPVVALHSDGSIRNGWGPWNSQLGTYFQADLPVPDLAAKATPADVLILVDTSGNGSLDQVRPALRTVLASLRAEDRFRLVCVDVVARPMHEGWLQTHVPESVAAYQKFEQQICIGATDMWATCQAVAPQLADRDPAHRPIVIYIGDGLHSVDEGALPTLAQRCAEEVTKTGAALFTINALPPPKLSLRSPPSQRWINTQGQGFFQFGPESLGRGTVATDPDQTTSSGEFDGRLFLSSLSRQAGGRHFDFSDADGDRARLFEWVLAGVPTPTKIENLQIAGCEAIDVYSPANLLPGEPFRIVGRRLGAVESLEISYQIANTPGAAQVQKLVLTANKDAADHLVGRYWAAQRLRCLQGIFAAPVKGGGNADAAKLIVSLSREWSLLTPQTAFLVLETEDDYKRWNVPRQGRRRYWSAQDVPTVKPLPNDWLVEIKPVERERKIRAWQGTGIEALDQQLDAATAAYTAEDNELATRILDRLSQHRAAVISDQYQSLRQGIAKRLPPVFHTLGVKQAWFEPDEMRLPLPIGTALRLADTESLTAEFRQDHPLAEYMLQEINLPARDMSLVEFARFLTKELGIKVEIDQVKFDEESIDQNERRPIPRLKNLSALNAIRHVLNDVNADVIEEPRRLLITTKTECMVKRQLAYFPIQDLVSKNPQFDVARLQDPLSTRSAAVARRIESKLKKLTSIHFEEACLDDLAERLRQESGENVVIRKYKLEEESTRTDATIISCDYDNVPLGDVLTWLLNRQNLMYTIDHEAITLTTKTDGYYDRRPTGLYSANGLLYRSTRDVPGFPLPRRPRNNWGQWGQLGFGGFGGGFPAMGGMGGGMGLGGGGAAAETGIPLIEVFSAGNDEPRAVESPPQQPPAPNFDVYTHPNWNAPWNVSPWWRRSIPVPSEQVDDVAYEMWSDIQDQTGGYPDSPWMEDDGDGGDVRFFYPSLAFVIQQTGQTHLEIEQFFRQRRELEARQVPNPNLVPVGPHDALSRNETDVESLVQIIESMTGGSPDSPWYEFDGEGGTISYDRPRMALAIRQTSQALGEVRTLLMQLRRERYALRHQTRPWENSLRHGPQRGLFDAEWLARAADSDDAAAPATEPELAALQVRRELPAGQWKWTTGTLSSSEMTLRTAADRLQLNWSDWEVRLQGNQGSAYAPQLRYAELGTWGNALRDWLDVKLVFWPHRSNRELASLFHVLPLPADKRDQPNHVRLQFTVAKPDKQPVWMHLVYDKTTGLPVAWEAYRQSALVQKFTFQPEMQAGQLVRLKVRQETPAGQLLGMGEWTPLGEKHAAISDPTDLPAGTLTIDGRANVPESLTAFEAGWQHLRRGQHALAKVEFRKVLREHPTHPLAQFCLAWSLNHQPRGVQDEELLAAYAAATQSGSSEFVRSLMRLDADQLSDRQRYELLNARQINRRDLQDELVLAKLSLNLHAPQTALTHAQAAWDRKPADIPLRTEVSQLIIESQLRLDNLKGALAQYERCQLDPPLGPEQLMKLLETFESFRRAGEVVPLYEQLLQRQDRSITSDMRRSLLKRSAEVRSGLERWRSLLSALELAPPNSKDAGAELLGLTKELTAHRDPAPAGILAAQAKSAAHRQALQLVQANVTADLDAAQKMYWQLHQEGFLFRDDSLLVAGRLIESQHPEQAVAVIEALVRARVTLKREQRKILAQAYTLTDRPLDAQRAISE